MAKSKRNTLFQTLTNKGKIMKTTPYMLSAIEPEIAEISNGQADEAAPKQIRAPKSVASLGLAAALGLCAVATSASAAIVNGSFDTLAGFALSDLELTDGDASDHWAIYGRMGYPTGGVGDEFTSKTATSPFSSATLNGTIETGGQLGGRIKFAHGAGFGDYPAATTSTDAQGALVQGNAGLISISFDYTMQGTGENLSIYLFNVDSAPTVDVSATMSSSGGSYTSTSVVLPSATSNNIRLGLLQLEITDATIGETMSFTVSADYSSTSGSTNFWGVGLAGASSTVTAVPEPGAFAMLAGVLGLGFVLVRRRR